MVLPAQMDAIEIAAPGDPDVLVPCRRPVPDPGHDEVLIRVQAAGVNRPDVMQRQGLYPAPPGASDLPGLEVAGEIVKAGAGVDRFSVGQSVAALVAGGGYAEYCVAPDAQVLPVPEGVSVVDAAGLPETFNTVWANVFERGRLQAGETLLVHGGASGIGTTAIQLGRAFGARVFATAGSDDRARACEHLGAERGINYKTEDFVAAVLEGTGDAGVDLILDMVGGAYFARNLDALKVEGRLSIIAFLGGFKVEANLLPLLQKRLTVTASTLRPRSVAEKGRLRDALLEHVWPLFVTGQIRPVTARTFPLQQAAAAHREMEAGSCVGKILLTVGGDAGDS